MISACIITKNESENLEKCLEALKKLDLEIVVVDTGSTDNTLEIAKKFADIVDSFTWCDNFAAARNYAAQKATNNIILMVDSDEVVINTDFDNLNKLIKDNPNKIGRITRENIYTRQDTEFHENELISRIYDRRIFQYKGRIHEQIVRVDDKNAATFLAPIYMKHLGYDGDQKYRQSKTKRNIRLLNMTLQESGPDPYIYYQLGKSYYMQGEHEKATEYFEQTFTFDLEPRLEYLVDAVESYGYALINCGQVSKALQLVNLYKDFSWSADYIFMIAHVYMQNEMFEEAVKEFLKATTYKSCKVQGVNSFLSYYNAGVIRECQGRLMEAVEFYKKASNYPKAVNRLNICSHFD